MIIPSMELLKSEDCNAGKTVVENLMRFLKTKKQLLLQYCANLSFYFMLKCDGVSGFFQVGLKQRQDSAFSM